MRKILIVIFFLFVSGCTQKEKNFSQLPVWDSNYSTTYTQEYDSGTPEEDELKDVQCPIPMDCRVRNYTGIQCVFSSLECLARWGEIKELLEPDSLTSRPGCKSYSGPKDASSKLNAFGVKFENVYNNKSKAIELLKRAMAEGRGALMDVPGHAIVICHYDEKNKIVKVIDNSDRSLRIQSWSMDKFNKLWGGWILVIYGKNDIFLDRLRGLLEEIPIIDKNNPQGVYPKNYIPIPLKD
jgi:hypothetical protein